MSWTFVLYANDSLQSLPQLMPGPPTEPAPDIDTVSGSMITAKFAVTFCAAVIVTLHAPVPLQSPPQPVNV